MRWLHLTFAIVLLVQPAIAHALVYEDQGNALRFVAAPETAQVCVSAPPRMIDDQVCADMGIEPNPAGRYLGPEYLLDCFVSDGDLEYNVSIVLDRQPYRSYSGITRMELSQIEAEFTEIIEFDTRALAQVQAVPMEAAGRTVVRVMALVDVPETDPDWYDRMLYFIVPGRDYGLVFRFSCDDRVIDAVERRALETLESLHMPMPADAGAYACGRATAYLFIGGLALFIVLRILGWGSKYGRERYRPPKRRRTRHVSTAEGRAPRDAPPEDESSDESR